MKDHRRTERGRIEDLEARVRRAIGNVSTLVTTIGGNTLDQAYDEGGPGAGRAVTVDSGAVRLKGATNVIEALEPGDTEHRFEIQGNGTLRWGPGGAVVTDTGLFRSGIDALTTSGQLITSGKLTAGTDAFVQNKLGVAQDVTGNEVFSAYTAMNVISAAGTVWNGAHFKAGLCNLTGGVNVTTATGLNEVVFERPTITSVSATTVSFAATVSIIGAPIAGGSVTITNAYAFWVQAGTSQFSGSVVVSSAALATTATDGFLYVPSCAGAPTGVPTSFPGRVPLVYDSTNKIFYVHDGGWRGVEVTS